MSIWLSFEDNSRWQAFITHSFWEWFVIWTIIVYFVAELLNWHAILALLIRLMCPLALSFHLREEMLKTFMLKISTGVLCNTVWTFFIGSMFALWLYILHVFFSYSQTIYTFTIWSMTAMRLLHLLFRERMLHLWHSLWWTVRIATFTCTCVDHSHIILLFGFLLNLWLSATHNIRCELCVLICYVYHITISKYSV